LPANPIRPETRTWRNWAGTVVHPVVQTTDLRNRAGHRFSIEAYNNTTRAIQRLIGLALQTRTQLRATGSGLQHGHLTHGDLGAGGTSGAGSAAGGPIPT
jgi:hypothetical protein